ncbi:methylmalonyl-CoA mutase family protein [Rhodococcus artemisiae]|uniref:Methylmalonyl-CoA mutase family protein n=1 Tax=Rhodococcus artemisiae TaxID=714159 RepID=A0ABU7LBU3_9NOCA|nr:methylmalonyl-CoA mutase family protein [Rhodococcus artemisiae]MEE2059012.1 methylmalonyl-CoA mutase family protein [Rhodococcus artemisiae]
MREEREELAGRAKKWENELYPNAAAKLRMGDTTAPHAYTPLDTAGHDFLRDVGLPGEYPFTSWNYPTRMPFEEAGAHSLNRAGRYSGYGTADDSRVYFEKMSAMGLRLGGPNVASDLPSQLGWDSDDPRSAGEVGRVGVTVDSLRDFEILYAPFVGPDNIDTISTNWTINAPAAVYMAFYCALADKRGIPRKALRCTPQNDILKEYIARGQYIFPVEPSMRLVRDTIEWVTKEMPKSNAISICAEHIRYAGSTAAQSIAFAFANGEAYVNLGLSRGLAVDEFVPRFTYRGFGDSTLDFYRGIATPRASRRIWARIMREKFGAKNDKTCLLRGGEHAWGNAYMKMTAQRPVNNIVRQTLEALIFGLASGQHTGSIPFDEPLGLGHSIEAQQIRRDLERILHFEARITDQIDPFAGSYFMESLTDEIEEEILTELRAVEEIGGASAAVESGYYKRAVGDAAWKSQRDIETGDEVWVGVNRFTGPDEIDVHIERSSEYDAGQLATAEERQVESVKSLRLERDSAAVDRTLSALRSVARDHEANIMPALIECAHAYATIGEICDVLRDEFGTAELPYE